MPREWAPDLAVGVFEIDSQHKELFKRINNLLDAMKQGKGSAELGNTLKFLEDYTVKHFTAEENTMRKHNYPGYLEQKASHERFIKELSDLKKSFQASTSSNLDVLLKVQRQTSDWLVNHISSMDKEIGRFLNTNLGI